MIFFVSINKNSFASSISSTLPTDPRSTRSTDGEENIRHTEHTYSQVKYQSALFLLFPTLLEKRNIIRLTTHRTKKNEFIYVYAC